MTSKEFDDAVFEGYSDGFSDDRGELPDGSNLPAPYIHGWKNGRDDRLRSPRASAQTIRDEYWKTHREAFPEYHAARAANPDECPSKVWEDTYP